MSVTARDRGIFRGLGGGIDGAAAEYFVCDEVSPLPSSSSLIPAHGQADAVLIPSQMTTLQGACLPVVFPTAWSSLFSHHPSLQAGETVLCLGTGGVSLAAAQLALINGAKVILTSSSQAKLDKCVEKLRGLVHPKAPEGTIQTINYSKVSHRRRGRVSFRRTRALMADRRLGRGGETIEWRSRRRLRD